MSLTLGNRYLYEEGKSRVDNFVIHFINKEGLIRGKIFRNIHRGESRIKRSELALHSLYFPGELQSGFPF